jgi:hypothetical protein
MNLEQQALKMIGEVLQVMLKVLQMLADEGSAPSPSIAKVKAKPLAKAKGKVSTPKKARKSGTSTGTADALAERVLKTLGDFPNGLRSEELKTKLGVERGPLSKALELLAKQDQVRREGEKRATTYFAV